MKAVLLSIKPKFCELIARGEKTIELRKSEPKLKPPFKCFIYCTKPKSYFRAGSGMYFSDDDLYRLPSGEVKYGSSVELMSYSPPEYSEDNFLNGTVIGEFICDYISKLPPIEDIVYCSEYKKACLSVDTIKEYAKGKQLYGWHISNLKIYDKPKMLNEFKRYNRTEENSPCAHTKWMYEPCDKCKECNLKRPPQSWCYVDELVCNYDAWS